MSSSDTPQSHADVQAKLKHHLWQKTKQIEVDSDDEEPRYYKLRISVLRDGEAVGDSPPRTFIFPSLHHLTHATNQLAAAFPDSPEGQISLKRSGIEAPNSEVEIGRGMEGNTENVSLKFESGDGETWKGCLEKLRVLETEWEGEGRGVNERNL